MFIGRGGQVFEKAPQTREVYNQFYTIYWDGIIFYPGCEEGQDSMQRLLNQLGEKDDHRTIMEKVMELCGSWSLFIKRLHDDKWLVFSDHIHLDNVYFTESCVSNSFLRIREDLESTATIDDECIASTLYCGLNFSPHAYYTSVERLDFTEYLTISNGSIGKFKKRFEDVFGLKEERRNYVAAMDSLFGSLKRHKICVDLTGGTDSRAIAICLDHLGYDFETATNGAIDYSEVLTAQQVASVLNKVHRSRNLSPHEIQESDLKAAWKACDGQDCALGSFLFERWRNQFGYTLVVGGSYGELYKDGGWFYQAVPNIVTPKGKKGYIQKLVRNGTVNWGGLPPNLSRQIFTEHYLQVIEQFLQKTEKSLLDRYESYPLFEIADRIFNEYSVNTPRGTGNHVIPRYSPLNERQMMRVGVNQTFFMRVNHMMYRRQIGKLNLNAARVPTDRQGLNMSPCIRDLLKDYLLYMRTAFGYLTKGALQTHKTADRNKLIIKDYLLNHRDTRSAYENLKDRHILADTITPQDVDANLATRMLVLYYMFERSQTGADI